MKKLILERLVGGIAFMLGMYMMGMLIFWLMGGR